MVKFIIALAACSVLAVSTALPTTLIVGGEEVLEGELPYQISVAGPHIYFCSGALVLVNGTQVVVTAAQCVQYPDDKYTLVAGDLNRNDTSGHEQIRGVRRLISHEGFNRFDYANDIALLVPDQPFDLNEWVQPISLPARMQETNGSVLLSGWGITIPTGGPLQDTLRKVILPTIDDETCQNMYARVGQDIASSMLCAGVGGKGGCDGDGGGPLKSVEGGYLAGMSSWGMGCAREAYPDVNTEVSHFIDWINDNVSNL